MKGEWRLSRDTRGFTLFLAALAALPPLCIDMGLPAIGMLYYDLAASPSQAAHTLSMFLAGFGVSQLVAGPLADYFGRRPVLLAGLGLFTLAGVSCALASTIETLLALRVLQGIGAAGATTLAMAVVRDLYQGEAARAKLSTITTIFAVAPMIAPSLGGIMLFVGGWRLIYLLLGLAGLVLLLVATAGFTETRPASARKEIDILGRYAAVVSEPRTRGYMLMNALNFGGLFAFISASSLVLMGAMGVSVAGFSVLFAITSGGIMAGAALNGMLARRGVSARLVMRTGLLLGIAAPMSAGAVLLAGSQTIAGFIPFIVVSGICRGMIGPNAAQAALEPVPAHAGSASALIGCSQTLVAAVAGAVVAELLPVLGTMAVPVTMLTFAAAALLAFISVERRGMDGT